ncbi:MAG: CTP synthetase, partial [Burkholderiaceae bacterium]
ARNVSKMAKANSTEFDVLTPYPVVALISEWTTNDGNIEKRNLSSEKGGTMRLGNQLIRITEGTLANKIYGNVTVERHRHRYEFNNVLRDSLQ